MCHDENARPPIPAAQNGSVKGEDLVLQAADGKRFAAYIARAQQPTRAQVLIYPDVRGVHQFYKELALRFAENGITALTIDYFGRTAGLKVHDLSGYEAHLQQMQQETFFADVTAGLNYLRAGERAQQATFVVGFCLGGALSFYTATRPTFDLAGVVGFYAGVGLSIGDETFLEASKRISVPLLGLFGGADSFVPTEQVKVLDHNLSQRHIEHEIVVYPGTPHSFFDHSAEQFAEASHDAWQRVLSFITAHTK